LEIKILIKKRGVWLMKFNQFRSLTVTVMIIILLFIMAACSSSQTSSKKVEMQTVRFSEVIRSIFYAPHYIAMEKGFFNEEGINVDMVTAQGSDKGAAALLSETADISLIGPETTIYIFNQKGEKQIKVFHQLTATDGSFLMSRNKLDNFNWSDVAGKTVVGWRPGSAPQMVLSHVLKKNQVSGSEVITNIAAPAMVGAFSSGKGDFIQVYEPVASMLESTGKAYFVASMGEAIGGFPETSYVATSDYIANNPEIVQKWINAVTKATKWVQDQPSDQVAETLVPYFEGTSKELIQNSVERYKKQNTWPTSPEMTQEQFNALQSVLIENGVLKENEKVNIEDIADMTYAKKAGKEAK
jgi:NitT/TauT family transport system substrate-binding protein